MRMYSVVGCNNCQTVWIVEMHPENVKCPRCNKKHKFKKLRKFVETLDIDIARKKRSEWISKKMRNSISGWDIEDKNIDDNTYFIGPDQIQEKYRIGENKKDRLIRIIQESKGITEQEIIRKMENETGEKQEIEKQLEKLLYLGEITENRGKYRKI